METAAAESIKAKIETESTSAMVQTANTTVFDHLFQVNTQYEMIDQYVSRRFGFSGPLVVFFQENPGVAMSICLKQEEIMLGMRSSLVRSDDMNKVLKDQIDHMTALHAEERQLNTDLRLEIQEKLMDQYAKAYLVRANRLAVEIGLREHAVKTKSCKKTLTDRYRHFLNTEILDSKTKKLSPQSIEFTNSLRDVVGWTIEEDRLLDSLDRLVHTLCEQLHDNLNKFHGRGTGIAVGGNQPTATALALVVMHLQKCKSSVLDEVLIVDQDAQIKGKLRDAVISCDGLS
jgi:hypothetical protein